MRTVCRNSFARHSIEAERVRVVQRVTLGNGTAQSGGPGCAECGQQRIPPDGYGAWLYRFHVVDDQGPRHSGPIAGGKLFCSRECCEAYASTRFDELR
jgi:hypothetical protein